MTTLVRGACVSKLLRGRRSGRSLRGRSCIKFSKEVVGRWWFVGKRSVGLDHFTGEDQLAAPVMSQVIASCKIRRLVICSSNLGVKGSNPFGRANDINNLVDFAKSDKFKR